MDIPTAFSMADTLAPIPTVSTSTSIVTATQTVTETVTETIQKIMETTLSSALPRGRHVQRRMPSIPARILTTLAPTYSRAFGRWGQNNPVLARFILASGGILAGTKLYRLSRVMLARARNFARERKRLRRERRARRVQEVQNEDDEDDEDEDDQSDRESGGAEDMHDKELTEDEQIQSDIEQQEKDREEQENIVLGSKSKTSNAGTATLRPTARVGVEHDAIASPHAQPATEGFHSMNPSTPQTPLTQKHRDQNEMKGSSAAGGHHDRPQGESSQPGAPTPTITSLSSQLLAKTSEIRELAKSQMTEHKLGPHEYKQQLATLWAEYEVLKKQRGEEHAKRAAELSARKIQMSSSKTLGSVASGTKRKLSLHAESLEEASERSKTPRSSPLDDKLKLDLGKKPSLLPSRSLTSGIPIGSPLRPSYPHRESGGNTIPANPLDNPPHLPPPGGPRRARNITASLLNNGLVSTAIPSSPSGSQTATPASLQSTLRTSEIPVPSPNDNRKGKHPQRPEPSTPAPGRKSARSTRNTKSMNVNTLSKRSVSPEKSDEEQSGQASQASPSVKDGKRSVKKRVRINSKLLKHEEREEREE
ncbi:hypothetical protein P153DRAFT_386206 [Dothidotthia symphoricarpi CBS 119687]|uniref:Uncharacterized protein n=1 Tax=Dothidotthia symphoricarpi CBS 119687 TaxID=1392245 RepID=A0A6A6ACP4_9PLEO|nr:uncharacterized protein P153DRAFT_386206 [Dothidotthia symphoricarpi CBS 119687]KAF2129013.1 hypothetical protein P153DRAFT_386206 [Dothidotthia symphoricarpi CBS 119687]